MKPLVACLLSMCFGVLVGFAVGLWAKSNPFDPGDDRLLGTWISDAERTVEEYRRFRKIDEATFDKFAALFGKMKVTYSSNSYSTSLDGRTTETRYRVLGKDDKSVVVEDIAEGLAAELAESSFSVIHFDGKDSHWIYMSGGSREYFKRVP
jgi:hypothetical protein